MGGGRYRLELKFREVEIFFLKEGFDVVGRRLGVGVERGSGESIEVYLFSIRYNL